MEKSEIKPELTAAEFRELLKKGVIGTGKKGRLKLTAAPGQAIEQFGSPESHQKPESPNQAKIRHPSKAREQSNKARFDIEMVLKFLRLEFEEEYRFDRDKRRKFRFDFMVPELRLGIEYEGIGFNQGEEAVKSRHMTLDGYTGDCVKYNLAAKQGWIVLRYTAKNLHQITDDLVELIKLKNPAGVVHLPNHVITRPEN